MDTAQLVPILGEFDSALLTTPDELENPDLYRKDISGDT